MLQGMKRELNFYPNVTFIYKQADGDSRKQIGQVKQLLAENIDLLIISPNEAEPLTAVVEEAYNKGIPVIVIDRKMAKSIFIGHLRRPSTDRNNASWTRSSGSEKRVPPKCLRAIAWMTRFSRSHRFAKASKMSCGVACWVIVRSVVVVSWALLR